MLEVVRQLEEIVRRHPLQWFQFIPFWVDPDPAALREVEARAARASAD